MKNTAELTKFNVIITDDQPLFREGLSKLVSSWSRAGNVGEAEGGVNLLEQLGQSKWDIVILDVDMPGMNGVETLRIFENCILNRK